MSQRAMKPDANIESSEAERTDLWGFGAGSGLRPCPFCGHRRVTIQRELRPGYLHPPDGGEHADPDAYAYYAVCAGCACQGPWHKTAGNARRFWNMRPLEKVLRAALQWALDEGGWRLPHYAATIPEALEYDGAASPARIKPDYAG